VRRSRNAPDIATTNGLRDRAIIAVVLGCALRRCAVAARTDGRCSGAFTPEATVAAQHANTPELWVQWTGFPSGFFARLRVLGAAGVLGRTASAGTGRRHCATRPALLLSCRLRQSRERRSQPSRVE